MYLETARSDREDEETSGARMRAPAATSSSPHGSVAAIHRDLFADVSCAKALIARFGEESDAFRIVTVDVIRHLSSADGTRLGRATAIVMAPQLSNGQSAIDAIEQIRGANPHVGLYILTQNTVSVARMLPRFAAAGVDDVFCFDVPSEVDAFEETLAARLSAPAPETEIRLLWKWFRESPERSLVMHCVRNGYRLDIWSIRSKVFNACRKTLQNRVSILGLPSPGILSRCGRVLHAQELERRGVKPTTTVAAILGFPSAGAMQRARRRLRKALMSRGRQALVFASLLK